MASPADCIESIRQTVGPAGNVLGAVSGGVDSTVAAVLLHRAIGDRFHAVMVDNGLLRKNERVQVSAVMVDNGLLRKKERVQVSAVAMDNEIERTCAGATSKVVDALRLHAHINRFLPLAVAA